MAPCYHPKLMPLEEALSYLINQLPVHAPCGLLSVEESQGHYLSEAVLAKTPIPEFANSAMDGYAFAFNTSSPQQTFLVTHKILAGDTQPHHINPGECAQIMTGAPMPEGADTVVMQENTQPDGDNIHIVKMPKQGANVRQPGDAITQGQQITSKGERITSAHIGLFASMGITHLPCFKPLTIGLFSTGDELKQPGTSLSFGQIYDSNRAMLKAMLKQLPVRIIDYGIISDDLNTIINTLNQANNECDAIITSAGVSVGVADFIKTALETLGKIEFWKVAIKPGKPFAFGKLKDSFFFGLPGNPVSAAITFLKLALPALAKMGGGQMPITQTWPAIATEDFHKKPGRIDFQRAIAHIDSDGQWKVRPTGKQGSATLASITSANCFAVLEQERGAVHAGEMIQIELMPDIIRN
ncbi:MAG: Molybdopterin molybdenumtransferase [Candidatus Celerinatantimonas neptuna]|nr:MAG: Molybdopterin molybdenumtransferase [Candidatus Celerinatantimonas neptuna]